MPWSPAPSSSPLFSPSSRRARARGQASPTDQPPLATIRDDPPASPLTTRFQYSLLDDPGFARLYPPAAPPEAPDLENTTAIMQWTVEELAGKPIPQETYDGFRRNLLWMMGGPMPKALLEGVQGDPAALNFVCSSLASQALWGNEVFWAEYRRRFDASVSPGFDVWASWFLDPRRQATLLLLPKR